MTPERIPTSGAAMPRAMKLSLTCLHLMAAGLVAFTIELLMKIGSTSRSANPLDWGLVAIPIGIAIGLALLLEVTALGLHSRRASMRSVALCACLVTGFFSLLAVFSGNWFHLIWLLPSSAVVVGLLHPTTMEWLKTLPPVMDPLPKPTLVRVSQLVGLVCVGCGNRIGETFDAAFCPACGNALHDHCKRPSTDSAICPNCGYLPTDHIRA